MMPSFHSASLKAHAATKKIAQRAIESTPAPGEKAPKPTMRSAGKEMRAHKVAMRLHTHAAQMHMATAHATNDPVLKQLMHQHAQRHIAAAKEHAASVEHHSGIRKELKAKRKSAPKGPKEFVPSEPLP